MTERQKLEWLITFHEGVRLKLYKDPRGIWTIGVGRNLETTGISNDEAYSLLCNDIAKRRAAFAQRFP